MIWNTTTNMLTRQNIAFSKPIPFPKRQIKLLEGSCK